MKPTSSGSIVIGDEQESHRCAKSEVLFDPLPDINLSDDNYVLWGGYCSCGRRVFEQYVQTPELFDEEGNEL